MHASLRRPNTITANTIIVTTLAAAAVIAAPAVAGTATLTIDSVGAEPGETVRVPIRLSSDDLVGAFGFVVDASGLMVADVDYNGVLFSNGWDGWDTAPAVDAQVNAACIFPEDQVTGDGIPLLDLLIDVPADAVAGSEVVVGLASASVSDYSFIPYDLTIVDGLIVVVTATCDEDVDNDGQVGFDDLLAVLAAWGPCESACAPDVDADGAIGMSDLLRILSRWGVCE